MTGTFDEPPVTEPAAGELAEPPRLRGRLLAKLAYDYERCFTWAEVAELFADSYRRLKETSQARRSGLTAADVVITMGCGDECPYVPDRRYEDWPIADPATASPEQVAVIRATIDARIRELLASLLPPDVTLPAPLTH